MDRKDGLTMLFDSSRCIGCDGCTAICKSSYNLSPNILRTNIVERKIENDPSEGKTRRIYYKNACLHCTEASCVMACPTGACHKNEDGLVVINEQLCISCNYCAKNCPYNAISYDKANGKVEKCNLCAERYNEGLEPLCAAACPEKAILFGPRSKILDYAKRRIEDLKGKGFADANLYGESNFGGQRVLAVLEERPKAYGLPENPEIPLLLRTFSGMPIRPVTLLAAGLVLGFNFVHSRKYERRAEEVREKHDKAPFCYVPPGQDEDFDLEAMEEKSKEEVK